MAMKKTLRDFSHKKRIYGFMFVLPWVIGFLLFFLIPLTQSLIFVFTEVHIGETNFETSFVGLENVRYIFNTSPNYVTNLVESIVSFAYSIPLIVAVSLIVAVVLNHPFRGRTAFRAIFFLPVIIATGVVITYIRDDAVAQALRGGSGENSYMSSMVDVAAVLQGMHLPESTTEFLVDFVNRIFDLFWNCGIQIVLFISGLQSIPEQLYDVSRVEGANKWEEFWYVTFPMLSSTLILVIVFTAIEMFTDTSNLVITQAFTAMQQQIYDISAAMLWVYFAIVGLMLGAAVLLLNRFIIAKWNR